MIRKQQGFSLIELLVALTVFIFAIAAASAIFVPLLNQYKQQSKMAETAIEGIVGLELLRLDIEHAGYGLPWYLNGANFNEAINDAVSQHDDTAFNDSINNPPRALISGDGVGVSNSDVLVIKAMNVSVDDTAQKWSYLATGSNTRVWGTEDLVSGTDRVIVIDPKESQERFRGLVVSGGAFSTTYNSPFPSGFSPTTPTKTYIIYGVNDTALRMPFNRADYFISIANVPLRCAATTGVLQKATVNHNDGGLNLLPILDCVADMQVVFGLDISTPPDDKIDCYTNNLSLTLNPFDAENVRERIKEVRVYILAHEGQQDTLYTFPNVNIRVGEANPAAMQCVLGEAVLGRDFNLGAIPDWQNYRWKVYTLVVKPEDLE